MLIRPFVCSSPSTTCFQAACYSQRQRAQKQLGFDLPSRAGTVLSPHSYKASGARTLGRIHTGVSLAYPNWDYVLEVCMMVAHISFVNRALSSTDAHGIIKALQLDCNLYSLLQLVS